MPTTRAFGKVGKTTWKCGVFYDDGDDPTAGYYESAEFPNKGLAKAWMNRTLPTHRQPETGQFWGRIERGTYIDDSFDDADYGYVHDATWDRDERPGAQGFAYLDANGVDVTWDEDER